MQGKSDYDLILGFFQVIDLLLNVSQVSNDALMKELQEQNKNCLLYTSDAADD